jgi:DNA (cytosine-5)-methyltransferase 1
MAVRQVFGGEVVWVADPDPGAAAILAHHHPHAPNLGDVTAVDWTMVPPVDVLTAGYPCQPFSVAGQRKGTDDERHIWPHVATALRVLRPRYAVLENVANHLRLGFGTVLGDLAALGFDAEWCLARASEVGAPHRRERLFVLSWPADAPRPRLQGAWLRGRPAERSAVAAADPAHLGHQRQRDARGRWSGPADDRHPAPDADGSGQRAGQGDIRPGEPDTARRAAPDAQGERRCEGRPEPARQPGGSRFAGGGGAPAADADRDGRERQQRGEPGLGARGDADRRGEEYWGRFAPAVARWEAATGRTAPGATAADGRLNPRFVEWMMGLPDGHVTDPAIWHGWRPVTARNAQLKALGNGVIPAHGAAAVCYLADRAGLLDDPRDTGGGAGVAA